MAEDRVSASSSSSSLFTLNRPKGLQSAKGRWERERERGQERQICPALPSSAHPRDGGLQLSVWRSPEAVQQVQHHSHHVHRQPHQQPQRALEGLHE